MEHAEETDFGAQVAGITRHQRVSAGKPHSLEGRCTRSIRAYPQRNAARIESAIRPSYVQVPAVTVSSAIRKQ